MTLETISTNKSHGGVQHVVKHASDTCQCDMTFAAFVPSKASTEAVPVLWYLSGLTCTHANVMEKGEYRAAAEEHGIIIICPDTSPRGDRVHDIADDWQIGSGAGFYVDATEAPWAPHYAMESYIAKELPNVVAANFNVNMSRQSIFGHSMGGHGAMTIALKNPGRFKSCSAFAPITSPTAAEWTHKALGAYLGNDPTVWAKHDTVELIKAGGWIDNLLVHQGTADQFLEDGLKPQLLQAACADAGMPLDLHMADGYDHSYYFISTYMAEHIAWHARFLNT